MTSVKNKYRRANILDGDDLSQEVYSIAVNRIHKYDPTKGPIYNWLSVTVNSRIINMIRDTNLKEIDTVRDYECSAQELVEARMEMPYTDFWDLINSELHANYRLDLIKLRLGVPVPSHRKARVISEIHRIIDFEPEDDIKWQ